MGDIAPECLDRRSVGLDEDCTMSAAGERLEPERTRTGEKVVYEAAMNRRSQDIEDRLAHKVGSRSGPTATRALELPASFLAGNDPHDLKLRTGNSSS
jgi:hypothetical protein